MNVLFYTTYDVSPQKGGTERITSTISAELRKNGIRCFLAYDCDIEKNYIKTPFDGKAKIGKLNKQCNLNKLQNFILLNDIDYVIIQGLFTKTAIIRKLLCNHKNIHIIFVHHFNPGAEETFMSYHSILNRLKSGSENKFKCYAKLLLLPILKIRYVLKLHKDYNKTYKAADKVVLLSKGFINDFVKYARIDDTIKFHIIHNALSFNTFYDMSTYQKHKEVIIVSRLEERQKRISMALDIWQLIENNPNYHDWVLKIVGTGSDELKYKQIVQNKRLKHVIFEGVQNPEPYYRSASIFIMTSSFEGWGLTLTEAQQYGVIPLAFNSYASLNDIIIDGYNGYIIPNNDIKTFSEAIMKLMSNPALRYKLASNCIKSSKRFEIEYIGKQWVNLFKELV